MNNSRRGAVRALLAGALAANLPAFAQTAGKDYVPVQPAQPGDTPGKIEVLEFFSYGCPHCNDFNPLIHAWAAKLPNDVLPAHDGLVIEIPDCQSCHCFLQFPKNTVIALLSMLAVVRTSLVAVLTPV